MSQKGLPNLSKRLRQNTISFINTWLTLFILCSLTVRYKIEQLFHDFISNWKTSLTVDDMLKSNVIICSKIFLNMSRKRS